MNNYIPQYPIDVVIPWVDSNDPQWQMIKDQYKGIKSADKSESRYRDWDNLQYIFRGIEKFWPWVNRVFLITCGQKPQWLNVNCKKLKLVNHLDYIPKEYLPTFSSNTIELNLHRIDDLSEHFIYLNDDFFPIRPMKPADFFRYGLPCDSSLQQNLLSIYVPNDTNIQYNDFTHLGLINAHFRKRNVTRGNLYRWYGPYLGIHGMLQALLKANQHFFTGFNIHHSAQPFLKSTFNTVWQQYPDYLHEHCQNKFRQYTDVNQWLIRYWQLAENRFAPYNKMKRRKFFSPSLDNCDEIVASILEQKYDIITINDNPSLSNNDFTTIKPRINESLNSLLPNKSRFEI